MKDLPAQLSQQETQINTDVAAQLSTVLDGLDTKAGKSEVAEDLAAADTKASDNLDAVKAELNTKVFDNSRRITNQESKSGERFAKIEENVKALQSATEELSKLKTDLTAHKALESRVALVEAATTKGESAWRLANPPSGTNLVDSADLSDTAGAKWTTPVKNEDLIFDTFIDGLPIRAMKSRERGKGCYGWGRTNYFQIDPTANYEFTIWVKAASKHRNRMSNYLGYYIYNDKKARITGGPHSNPYFKTNRNDGGEWSKVHGYLLAKDFNTMDGYKYKIAHDSMFFVNDASAKYAILRFGSCYAEGDDNDETYWTLPSVRELSSARDLLGESQARSHLKGNEPYENQVRHSNLLATNVGADNTEKWNAPVNNLIMTQFQVPGGPAFPIVAQQSVEGATAGCYGGWGQTNLVPINPNLRYEFSIWIKSDDNQMNNYFGFHVFDSNKNRLGNQQVAYGNPYFKCSDQDPEEWTQYFGYLGGNVHNNVQCGSNTGGTLGDRRVAAWRLQSNVKFALLRFGSCYAGGNSQGRTMYAFPRITEMLVT